MKPEGAREEGEAVNEEKQAIDPAARLQHSRLSLNKNSYSEQSWSCLASSCLLLAKKYFL